MTEEMLKAQRAWLCAHGWVCVNDHWSNATTGHGLWDPKQFGTLNMLRAFEIQCVLSKLDPALFPW